MRGREPAEPSNVKADSERPPSWAFVLDELGEVSTRLTAPFRLDYRSGIGNTIGWRGFTEPAHFVMERKMLLGTNQRAERRRRLQAAAKSSHARQRVGASASEERDQ